MVIKKGLIGISLVAGLSGSLPAQAISWGERPVHPFYIGGMLGYGSTTWTGLVPAKENQNAAVNVFTPIDSREGGGAWGVFAGYEFASWFAAEANYIRYRDARVFFDPMSVFTFTYDLTELHTRTEAWNLIAKFMLPIPETNLRIFSGAGVARTHRKDILHDHWRIGPAFVLGLNFPLSEHAMGEIGANYTAGYGESRLDPAQTFIPFQYSVGFRVAYKI